MTMTHSQCYLTAGRNVIDIEIQAIELLKARIDEQFVEACKILHHCPGRIIVIGVGKSGHIGHKIAATLASTGSPAFFVHPSEASHGDLGMITQEDVVIAISNSGETSEITELLPIIKRLGIPLISITGQAQSTLAQFATINLSAAIEKEACPLNLAPTASTTATLVMGDAIAIALLEAKGFSADDFALSHPGGSLGKRLLLKVEDLMHTGEALPQVQMSTPLRDALFEMTNKRMGMTAVTDHDQKVLGIFTDGDLRRTLATSSNLENQLIEAVMTPNCQTIAPDILAAEAAQIMEKKSINALLVVNNEHQLIGAINMHDLLKSGIV